MHDARAVRSVEGVRDLRAELDDVGQRQRPLRDARGERLAVYQFHHQEIGVAFTADIEERADMGMVERRNRLRLALEARADLGMLRKMAGQHLHGDVAAKARIARAIHFAHAARAEGFRDFVGSKLPAGSQ